MKKNFSANLLFLLILNLLIKPIYVFGIEVGIQNEVGPSEYGLYYAMFNFTFLFNVVLDMGINNYQKIKVAENAELGMANMSKLLPLKLALGLLYMMVTVVAALIIGFEERYWFFIGWLMLNHVLMAFLLLLRANLSGLHLFARDSIVSIIDRLLLVMGIGYLLFFGSEKFQIEWFAVGQSAAYVLAIVFAVIMTPAGKRFPKLSFKIDDAIEMIRSTWPFALLILLMTAYNRIDGVMLERLAIDGTREAGIYAQAYRIIDAGNSFAFLYAGMLLPIFSRLIKNRAHSEISILVNQAARFLIVPAGIATIVSIFYSEWFMQLLYNQVIEESARSFALLMGSFLCICIGYVFGTYMTAENNLKALNQMAFVAVLINVSMNFILIPIYGAYGAALSSLTSLAFLAMAQLILVQRKNQFVSGAWFMRAALVWGVTFLGAFCVEYLSISTSSALMVTVSIALVAFVLVGLKRSDLQTSIPS